MKGVWLPVLLLVTQVSGSDREKLDALRAVGADVRIEGDESWVDFSKPVTDAQLSGIEGLKSLTALRILAGSPSDAFLDRLKDSPRLWLLVVKSDRLTDVATTKFKRLPKLKKLDMMGAKLTARGLKTLASLPSLEQLYLHGANLKPGSVGALGRATRLTDLTLPERYPAREIEALRKLLPKVRIEQF